MSPLPEAYRWEPFPLSTTSDGPSLFLLRSFTPTSYSVYMTDLINVWGESLSKDQICDRAEDSNSSIDPSTDDSQLSILLGKLDTGLIGGSEDNVAVELDVRQSGTTCTLQISTKEVLEAPLAPLIWRFRLKSMNKREFSELVLLPSLAVNSVLSRQVDSLLEVIKEKDVAVQRMLEKMENLKIDMSTVFPGYKKTNLGQGKTRGLVEFKENLWRENIGGCDEDLRDVVTMSFRNATMSLGKLDIGDWWTKWEGKANRRIQRNTAETKTPKDQKVDKDEDEDEDNGSFQVNSHIYTDIFKDFT